MGNKYASTRIWKETVANLRMIYALTGESMVSILDRLVVTELNRIGKEPNMTVKLGVPFANSKIDFSAVSLPAFIPEVDSSIVLRRESDNAEETFQSADDAIAILDWLNGSDGYVKRWGSLVSSATSKQPRWIPAVTDDAGKVHVKTGMSFGGGAFIST